MRTTRRWYLNHAKDLSGTSPPHRRKSHLGGPSIMSDDHKSASESVKYVDHTYRDYSTYLQNGGQLIKHKKSDKNFPVKMHRILSNPMYSHIITWMVR